MKNIKSKLIGLLAVCVFAVLNVSCGDDMETAVGMGDDGVERTAVMHLQGIQPAYADDRTRSAVNEWEDGAVVYLRFYLADNTTVVCGRAVYQASLSLWNVSYYGNLSTGNVCKCEAFYFVGATAKDNYNIDLDAVSAIYSDEAASYMVDGGELFVNANLMPKMARMRIKGTPGKEFRIISGLKYNFSFNLTNKEYATSSYFYRLAFDESGYTPYLYVELAPANTLVLDDGYYKYTKTFDPARFVARESGYIVMPSQQENKGWEQEYYYPSGAIDMGLSVRWASFNVNDQEFDMPTSWGDIYGTNTSTNGSYNSTISEIAGNPAYDIATYQNGERWRMPTKEQWEELMEKCTWTYAYNSSTREYGYTVTAANGNSIYLPMYNRYSGSLQSLPLRTSSSGYYWTATQNANYSYNAYMLHLNSTNKSIINDYKYYRAAVRPVLVR